MHKEHRKRYDRRKVEKLRQGVISRKAVYAVHPDASFDFLSEFISEFTNIMKNNFVALSERVVTAPEARRLSVD